MAIKDRFQPVSEEGSTLAVAFSFVRLEIDLLAKVDPFRFSHELAALR